MKTYAKNDVITELNEVEKRGNSHFIGHIVSIEHQQSTSTYITCDCHNPWRSMYFIYMLTGQA